MTKLEAVNKILRRAGGYPVAVLDEGGASAAAEAQRCLEEESKSIQSTGWNFNTRSKVQLTPDGSGFITMPAGTLHLDSDYSDATRNITHRGERLYDLDNNTNVFSAAIYVKLVELWEFHCLPEPVAEYITSAATFAFNTIRGTRERERGIVMERERAKGAARVWNNRQLDASYVKGTDAQDILGERQTYRSKGYA